MPATRPDQRDQRPTARIDATAVGPPSLRAIELLCREGLVLRRLEYRIEVVGAGPELRRLLDAAGLARVLPCVDEGRGGPGGPSGVESEG